MLSVPFAAAKYPVLLTCLKKTGAWIFDVCSLPFHLVQVPQGIILQAKQPTSTSQAPPVLMSQFSSQPSSVLVSSQGQPVTVTTTQAPPVHGHVPIPATIQPSNTGPSKGAPMLEKGQVPRGGQPAQPTALLQQQTPVLVKSTSICKWTPLWSGKGKNCFPSVLFLLILCFIFTRCICVMCAGYWSRGRAEFPSAQLHPRLLHVENKEGKRLLSLLFARFLGICRFFA